MPRNNNAKRVTRPSAALAVWAGAPKAEGLTIDLDIHVEEFWDRAATDTSKHLEDFLFELAGRIRNGHADVRERLLAARLIERQWHRPLPAGEHAARQGRAIAEFVTLLTVVKGEKQEAAVAAAEKKFGCSRRTIFTALKAAREAASADMADVFARPVQRRR